MFHSMGHVLLHLEAVLTNQEPMANWLEYSSL